MFWLALGLIAAAAVGGIIRYLAGLALNDEVAVGTLLVNLFASAGMGFMVGVGAPWAVIVSVGALGSLSTWSAAANETAELARQGKGTLGLAYLSFTVTGGVLSAWVGLKLGHQP